MKKQRKTVTKSGDLQKGSLVVAVKLQMLKELAGTIRQEVTALTDYMTRYAFLVENAPFDLAHGINLPEEVRRLEIELITYALKCTRGNQRDAAHLLGLKPTTLNAKLKVCGIKARHLKRLSHATRSMTEREPKLSLPGRLESQPG